MLNLNFEGNGPPQILMFFLPKKVLLSSLVNKGEGPTLGGNKLNILS